MDEFTGRVKQRVNVLTVILRDDGPVVHVGDVPSFRSVQIELTEDQCERLLCRETHEICDEVGYESISRCFLEWRNIEAKGGAT